MVPVALQKKADETNGCQHDDLDFGSMAVFVKAIESISLVAVLFFRVTDFHGSRLGCRFVIL
jgi:hypothetical protein